MKLLDRIFATPEAIEKTVDAAIASGDKLFYTNEEKADARTSMRDWYLRYLEATTGQNLARRFIAMVITGIWATITMVAILAYPINKEFAEHALNVLEAIVLQPYNLVIAFYFCKQIMESYRKP